MPFTITVPCWCCGTLSPCECPECDGISVDTIEMTFGEISSACVYCSAVLAFSTVTLTRVTDACLWVFGNASTDTAFTFTYSEALSTWVLSVVSDPGVACDDPIDTSYHGDFSCADGGELTFFIDNATPCHSTTVKVTPVAPRACDPGFAAKPPGLMAQAASFVKATARHALNMARVVTEEEYNRRMDVCNGCEMKKDNQCLQCGCRLTLKAKWASEDCPLNKW